MKKPDLIKQLANRINQPHVIESWINKVEKAAYNKGCKDTESKQFVIPVVSNQRELLIAFCDWYNKEIPDYLEKSDKTIDRYLESNL